MQETETDAAEREEDALKQVAIAKMNYTKQRGLAFLLFASLTSLFRPLGAGGDEPRGAEQPSGQHHARPKTPRLPGQQDEDRLGDILGQMRIPELSQRGSVDQAQVAFHEGPKSGLGAVFDVILQELPVVHGSDAFSPASPPGLHEGTSPSGNPPSRLVRQGELPDRTMPGRDVRQGRAGFNVPQLSQWGQTLTFDI